MTPAPEPEKQTPRPNQTCFNSICPVRNTFSAKFVRAEFSNPLKTIVEFYHCDICGQVQARRSTGHDRRWVREYGFLWQHKLTELWNQSKWSHKKIARALSSNFETIIRQALKLGLPNPRPGKRKIETRRFKHLLQSKEEILAGKVKRLRGRWMVTWKRHPQDNARQLRARSPAVYASLFRYDRQWLHSNQPTGHQWWPKNVPRLDWEKRDSSLCQRLFMRTNAGRELSRSRFLIVLAISASLS